MPRAFLSKGPLAESVRSCAREVEGRPRPDTLLCAFRKYNVDHASLDPRGLGSCFPSANKICWVSKPSKVCNRTTMIGSEHRHRELDPRAILRAKSKARRYWKPPSDKPSGGIAATAADADDKRNAADDDQQQW